MADQLESRGAPDRSRIDINQAHEVNYWTGTLGVSEAELRTAVASVGVSAEDIRVNLGLAPHAE